MLITAKINDVSIIALANSGSTLNFVSACCAKNLDLAIVCVCKVVRMADSSKLPKKSA